MLYLTHISLQNANIEKIAIVSHEDVIYLQDMELSIHQEVPLRAQGDLFRTRNICMHSTPTNLLPTSCLFTREYHKLKCNISKQTEHSATYL